MKLYVLCRYDMIAMAYMSLPSLCAVYLLVTDCIVLTCTLGGALCQKGSQPHIHMSCISKVTQCRLSMSTPSRIGSLGMKFIIHQQSMYMTTFVTAVTVQMTQMRTTSCIRKYESNDTYSHPRSWTIPTPLFASGCSDDLTNSPNPSSSPRT